MNFDTQKTAGPKWDDIKNTISGGVDKARGMLPSGANNFIKNHGADVASGLAGAAIGGGIYGVTASRRSYETEEEFKRRRFRGALQTAAATGTLVGLAGPIKRFVSGPMQDYLKGRNDAAIASDIASNPRKQWGNLAQQAGEKAGLPPEVVSKMPTGSTNPADAPVEVKAQLAAPGITETIGKGTGQVVGGAAGARIGWGVGGAAGDRLFRGPSAEELTMRGQSAANITAAEAKALAAPKVPSGVNQRNITWKGWRPGLTTGKPVMVNQAPNINPVDAAKVKLVDSKDWAHLRGRGASRVVGAGVGGVGGVLGGGIIGGKAGAGLGHWLARGLSGANNYDPNWLPPTDPTKVTIPQ